MLAWIKLIRIKNLLLISISQILMVYFLFSIDSLTIEVLAYIFCTFCLAAAGNIINDYFDTATDKINKPNKQIIDISISSKKAYLGYLFFNLLGLISGTYICFVLNSITLYFYGIPVIILLYLYSKKLKGILLVGNLFIASFTGLSILFFLMIIPSTDDQKQIIYVLSFFAFLLNFTREIIKDIEDINGDYKANLKTLPIVIGTKSTVKLSKYLILTTLISLASILYFINNIYLKLYIIITLVTPLAYCILKLKPPHQKQQFTSVSQILKLVIAFGIFTLLFI